MNPNDFDLTRVSSICGIANTPYFLLRKLQDEPIVRDLSDRCSAEAIVTALRDALARDPLAEPGDPIEAVRPYVFLVALWFKPEIEHLQEASRVSATSWRWFDQIAQMLIETYSRIENKRMHVPGTLPSQTISIGGLEPTLVPLPIVIARA